MCCALCLVAVSGVITYTKKGGDGKPIFSCHPVEKPFCTYMTRQTRPRYPPAYPYTTLTKTFGSMGLVIYQIGTSDPELAVQAAKTVEQDVAGL